MASAMTTTRAKTKTRPKAATKPRRPKRASVVYVLDASGNPVAVVVPVAECQALLARLEDLEDIVAAEHVRREETEWIPLETVEARLRSEGKLI
jgi:hypothetical protein